MTRTVKSALFLSLCALLLAATSAAAPAQDATARQVIERHIEAIGGRAAIESHSSSYASGMLEVVGQGLVGEMSIWAMAPNKTLVKVSFPDMGIENSTGYDGEVGWSIDPMTGERLLQGGELEQLADEAAFYGDLHDPARYTTIESLGEVEFDGRSAHKLHLVFQSGREVYEYFDVESGRMIGVEGVQESIMGSMNVVTTLGEYQQFGDLMVPTQMVQDLGGVQSVRVTIQSVEIDSVDPSMFDLPLSIQALIR